MTTIGTIFSGGEGVGVGARQAGIDHLWGVEYDDAIAQVARDNGFNTITGNVMDTALMLSLPRPDVLHASPVCKNASNAKANGEESPLDIATADATCAYISHFLPDIFTLENVWGYRTFTAFAHIIECLNSNGYNVNYWHLNAANYGVPQTRQRLILVARLHGKPVKPLAIHARHDKLTPMFDTRLPWVGWYAAIEDLIDTLPASKFASWQLERLPDEITTIIFQPPFPNSNRIEKFKQVNAPYDTIDTTAEGRIKAFIINTREGHHGDGITLSEHDDPIYTLPATSSIGRHKAFIVDGKSANYEGDLQIMAQDDPTVVITASQEKHQFRAWLSSGRVVKMTPRALARFQSMPDSYILPDKARLACTVIGNSVPPLLYQRVIEAQL
jgi:DNA (cytosine-5)-methyltransferase 1